MDESTGRPQAIASARRRLLRGSFAVPIVATLHSGSALAASSTLRCFRNAPTGANVITGTVKPGNVVEGGDNIWRIKRYRTRLQGDWFHVFSGSDIKAVEGANSGYLSVSSFAKDQWYRVDTGSGTAVGNGDGNAPSADGSLLALRLVSNDDPMAPKFTIVGVATGPMPSGLGQIMTMSCWGSVF